MGDVFPETHRLIAVLPVAFLALTVVFLQEALTLSQWAGVLAILGTGVFVGLTEKAAES
jgi:drug/metabolite transporter (DMT)-like permease